MSVAVLSAAAGFMDLIVFCRYATMHAHLSWDASVVGLP